MHKIFVLLFWAFFAVVSAEALTVTAPFKSEAGRERATIDISFKRDLSSARGISFRFKCGDMAAFRGFSCYVKADGKWLHSQFAPIASSSWQTIRINKERFTADGIEGSAPWAKIDTIRIAGWKGNAVDSEFAVEKFEPVMTKPLTVVLRAWSTIAQRGSGGDEAKYAATLCRSLDELGFEPLMIDDTSLTASMLTGIKLVALPMNSTIAPSALVLLESFVKRGGKVMAFYLLAPGIDRLLGITPGKLERPLGGFSGFDIANGGVAGQPAFAPQASWAATRVNPGAGAKTIAFWRLFDGKKSSIPAAVLTGRGIFLSHIWMGGTGNAADFLRSLCVALQPHLGEVAVAGEMRRLGIASLPKTVKALSWCKQLDYLKSLAGGALIRRGRAIAPTVKKRLPFRGIWCHSAWGVPGENWETTARRLSKAGINNVFVNIAWGGVAYYNSKVLPYAQSAVKNGSPVAPCIEACRKNGIAFHAWKVCFNGSNGATPASWTNRMRKEGRFTRNSKGVEKVGWLCPTHPDNRRDEVRAALELAALPGVAGVHLDYIRFSSADYCFCQGCRDRFEHALGRELARWPADVLPGGCERSKWEIFRRNNITDVVKRISTQLRQEYPDVKFSVAAFDNYRSCRTSIGQDWKLWCDKGWIDFVCPMNYVDSAQLLASTLAMQKAVVKGSGVKMYPGLGYSVWKVADRPEMLFDQIKAVSDAGLDGVMIYALDASSGGAMPVLQSLFK